VNAGGCRVRPFEAGDAGAVSAMVEALNIEDGQHRGAPPDAAGLRAAFLGADATGFLLVAQAEAAPVVGYATGHATYETEFAARGFYMGDLYVAREHRRRGVGRALVAGMAAEARARGARFLWWTALPGNAGAHGFYRALGCRDEPLRAFVLADEAFNRLVDQTAP